MAEDDNVRVQHVLASAGVNSDTGCLDWNTDSDVVAYAASCFVFINHNSASADVPQKVQQTCTGHSARVNCVRWMRHVDDAGSVSFAPSLLVTGSSDKTLRLWRKSADVPHTWSTVQVLKEHAESVTDVEARSFSSGRAIIASSAGDETVRLWQSHKPSEPFELLQVIATPRHYMMALSLALLPSTDRLVLACGGDDMRVHVYAETASDGLVHQDSLPGHEDWVRSLDFTTIHTADGSKALLLASGAQDCFIRLWKIAQQTPLAAQQQQKQDKFEAMLQTSERIFHVDGLTFCSSLDALLAGHENKSGMWLDGARMGEVGGNTLGFFGAVFGPRAQHVLGHSFHGALHHWEAGSSSSSWTPRVVVSGHFKGVYDLDWSPSGDYLLTCSDDQTTRLFAPWQHARTTDAWHELGRPQVHGYDLRCLAVIDDSSFASGADEKVLRVFEAPQSFFTSFQTITGTSLTQLGQSVAVKGRALGASVPALGLSNKPVYEGDTTHANKDTDSHTQYFRSTTDDAVFPFESEQLQQPPFEAQLVQNTLWPETRKLYGHGYELMCVACDHQRTVLVSACKATKPEHAALRLWSIQSGLEVAQLPGHKLTVVKVSFSPDDRWLVSVSRDRAFCVYERVETEAGPSYELRFTHAKAHDRIIWDVAWVPDSKHFITGARDKHVKVWAVADSGEATCTCTLPKFPDSVTALAVTADTRPSSSSPSSSSSSSSALMLAVGLDKGAVHLHRSADNGSTWAQVHVLDDGMAHRATVRRLKWRPNSSDDAAHQQGLYLASCGLDHVVRINLVA
ncbi:hypothetical protein PTSG_02292 [Salpingoeca rosetta]|uniref:Elongator complex protein 2 n=1 Tax=Salpingoeca rosetta (strain ATCC 50818 / BSB-021) TaxID=946362 RepID=F2U1S5_SALR5|nr:uncharacterized protein PTSG_02292 [Salpingoeca rosetta]EGD81577.1 hypothetical protein PTSG_02292 [Salpingoeca rosetta]|eukprot:XP_004996781.1 hypothetical protein PTSG_02292 [Salpingoeca rosetta]